MNLLTPILQIPNSPINEERAGLLGKYFSIVTVEDLLFHLPYKFLDKSNIYPLSQVVNWVGKEAQFLGTITKVQEIGVGTPSKRLVTYFFDDNFSIQLVWFRYPKWLVNSLPLLKKVIVYGQVLEFSGSYSIAHPEISVEKDKREVGLQPVYYTSEKLISRGINQKLFRTAIHKIVFHPEFNLPSFLPEYVLVKLNLPQKLQAFRSLHFPQTLLEREKSLEMLKIEECIIMLGIQHYRKLGRESNSVGHAFSTKTELFNNFIKQSLPFPLTNAQNRVIEEIYQDMSMGKQMNRLLQGDVGSGKTIVAFLCMLIAVGNGTQSCLMAPTEILARQHFASLEKLSHKLPIQINILTGSTKKSDRERIHRMLHSGDLHILVGTHALLEDPVQFRKLGLAVIDEQHRFGVAQRGVLYKKNEIPPHILLMTATPIPRTLAMTYFADLPVSIIDELPAGRKPILTVSRKDKNRPELYAFIRDELRKGRQVYIVYPLIEESEVLTYKNVSQGWTEIQSIFPEYKVEMLHGGMNTDAKNNAMASFKNGNSQILVATTVIEVGVDVPNASIMMIENADKFGLSQLHQLRGRVGRGAEKSFCILMASEKISKDGRKRIQTMCETQDGFKISEVDLQLRGSGDVMGTRQSGSIEFRFLDPAQDSEIVELSGKILQKILDNDPNLQHPDNEPLQRGIKLKYKEAKKWSKIS